MKGWMERLAQAVAVGDVWLGPRPRRGPLARKLTRLAIYATNRCNSRCRICGQWQAEPKVDLPVEIVERILAADCVTSLAHIELEGGEFTLHPQYDDILRLMAGRRYGLVSNGLLADELIAAVRRFAVPRLSLSLDGGPEAYRRVRGVDSYAAVLRVVNELHRKTQLTIIFTFNPWNGPADYAHVRELCHRYGLPLGYNIYSDMAYFAADRQPEPMAFAPEALANPYVALYNDWLAGRVRLPCLSIRSRLVVYPDGAVPLCQQKMIPLGNLHHESLDDIWHSPRTHRLWREHAGCNDCWVSYHRPFDLRLVGLLERWVGRWAARRLWGDYRVE